MGAYLDWNATTPLAREVREAMLDTYERGWANPASPHTPGRRARGLVEDAREELARLTGFEPRGVIFTSGATEANNWALLGAGTLLTSRLEHPSITRMAEAAMAAGETVVWLDVEAAGVVSVDSLRAALERSVTPVQVALTAVQHETGVIQPLAEVARLVHRHGSRLHVDAAQWFGKAANEALQGADTLSLAAHKLSGPKGIGALVFRQDPPARLLHGGAQERGLRPGTQDAALAVGFAVAARLAHAALNERQRLAVLRDRFEAALARWSEVNGVGPRLGHVSNLSFPGVPGPELVAALDLEGVFASSGSACSAGTSEPSAAITAMLGAERARTAVRFSLGATTTEGDIEHALSALAKLLPSMSGSAGD